MTENNAVAHYLSSVLPERPGFQANKVQIDYSRAICTALANPGELHFVEGDTGIGKSLAYTIAIADWIARGKQHGRRAVVSTFSRSLQRQLLSPTNQEIIQDYLRWQQLPEVSMGLRMGRQNYLSRDRLALNLGAESLEEVITQRARPANERQIAEWALDTEGCLLDIDPNVLPDGITLRDIALTSAEALPQSLSEHFESMRSKDILVINHALLTLDLVTNGRITDSEEPYVMMLDEAEHYPDAAESILSTRISLRGMQILLRRMGLRSALAQCQELFDRLVSPRRAGTAESISLPQREHFIETFRAIMRARPQESSHDSHVWAEWLDLKRDANAILSRMKSDNAVDQPVLTYSAVQGFPGIVLQEPSAGGSLKIRAKARSTILTSATLSDMRHGLGEPPSYQYIRSRLRLGRNDDRIGIQHSFQPLEFGRLTFRLPDDMPDPLLQTEEGTYRLSPTYARRAVPHITEVGGRTLVLCVSYEDTAMLLTHWPESSVGRVVTHAPGDPLNEIASNMPEDGILLTPSGWEGLSPPRGQDAFWKHVVILRNPNPAPSTAAHHFLWQEIRRTTKTDEEAHRITTAQLYRRASVQAAHKIRQGIGRAIRHPDDQVVVTLLDPRFPRPTGEAAGEGMRVATNLLGAIPHRFMSAWADAGKREKPTTSDIGMYL